MLNRKIWIIVIGALLITLVSATALAEASPSAKKVTTSEEVVWELTKTEVVDPGQTLTSSEGTLITGYVIEAKAKAKNNNVVPEGQLRLTMSLFSPNEDMLGQKAGLWYVQGKWTITKKDYDPATVKVRHNPDVMEGDLQTELTFNPRESQQNWSAAARLPMSLAVGRWSKGDGSFSFNGQLEGDLFLALELWPEVQ
jgi:hypothetical protein